MSCPIFDDDARSSCSSLDEDETNQRVSPDWSKYRGLLEGRGFRLDTYRDVKDFYHDYAQKVCLSLADLRKLMTGYSRACEGEDDNALCKDAGLPDHLFRGSRMRDNMKIVVKAVHFLSREFEIMRFLTSPVVRGDPRNHCIPVLALVEVPSDHICFVVMEEWQPLGPTNGLCCPQGLLHAIRQSIEHCAFLHAHQIAHLDISTSNILTNNCHRFAVIDYEGSRRFDGIQNPRLYALRGTEIPPELEIGEATDPYKADIWALGVIILRLCQKTGYRFPELASLVLNMLHENREHRPTANSVLFAFDLLFASMPLSHLDYAHIA